MLKLTGVCRDESIHGCCVHVLSDISLDFKRYGLAMITGPSGCGSAELIDVIAHEAGFTGTIAVGEGTNMNESDDHSCIVKVKLLMSGLTVSEEMMAVLSLAGFDRKECTERIHDVLIRLNLQQLADCRTDTLTLLQRMQVSIASALSRDPWILLCAQPTESLDEEDSREVMKMLKRISRSRLVIAASDHMDLALQYADRIISMRYGHVEHDSQPGRLNTVSNAGAQPECGATRRPWLPVRLFAKLELIQIRREWRQILSAILIETLFMTALLEMNELNIVGAVLLACGLVVLTWQIERMIHPNLPLQLPLIITLLMTVINTALIGAAAGVLSAALCHALYPPLGVPYISSLLIGMVSAISAGMIAAVCRINQGRGELQMPGILSHAVSAQREEGKTL